MMKTRNRLQLLQNFSADLVETGEGAQDLGDLDGAVLLLIIFHDGNDQTVSGGSGTDGVDKVTLVTLLVADVETAALEAGQVGVAGDLTVGFECGIPGFDIVLFVTGCAQVAHADIDHMIGQAQCLKQSFLIFQTEFVVFGRFFRFAENDLLNFMELMHPENTFGCSAVTASFSTETGSISRVAQRQFGTVKHVISVIADQRLFTGSDQCQILTGDIVGLIRKKRQISGTEKGTFFSKTWGHKNRKTTFRKELLHPEEKCLRQHRPFAFPVIKTGLGQLWNLWQYPEYPVPHQAAGDL